MHAVYFAIVCRQKRSSLGIGTIIMSLGIVYYDPKHPAGFGSVANLVKAGKNNKNVEDDRQVKIRTLYINL